MSLIEFLLLVISVLLAVIAFNTTPQPLRSQVGTGLKYVSVVIAVTAGLWFLMAFVIRSQ